MNSPDPKSFNEERAPRQSLRRTYQLVFAALFALALAQLAISVGSNRRQQDVAASQQRRYEAYLIASELRLSADDLTRMAQSFAVSGDLKFELYYNQIVAIRDGLRPRPEDYDKVYWELVVALGRQPPVNGESLSFDQRIRAAGFTEAEVAKLREVKHQSDSLMLLERVAMNAVKGSYRDAAGQFTLRGAPNRGYALQLLHGPEYRQARARVMKSIRDVQVMVDHRTRTEGQRLSAQAASLARVETWLLIVAVILVALAFIILNRQIITPILELAAAAANVGRNGFLRRVLIARNDELGTLAGALNRMSETVEQKLSESAANEERFRSLIEDLPDALLFTDAGGKIQLVNRQTESLLGYGRTELLGQQLTALLPAAAGSDTSSTSATSRELTVRRKDGVAIPLEVIFRPITAPDGRGLSCGVLRDLTARQSAAAAIERHLHFQAVLLDAIPHPMFIKDLQARFVTCNQAYEATFGVGRDFLLGKTLLDLEFMPEDRRLRFQAEEEEVIRTTARRSYELPICHRDQTERVMRYTVEGVRLADSSPGGLIGLLVDITDRKQTEAELGRSQRLTQAVMDNANASIYVKDTQGRYLFVNRNYETLLGRPATELIGRSATDLFGRKAGAAHEEGDREVRQTREPHEREEASEINGVTRQFISRKFPLVNEQGELLGTAGVSTEITELKRLRQELAGAKEAASKAGSAGVEPTGLSKTEFEPRDLDAVMASLQGQPVPAQPPSPDAEFDSWKLTGKRVLLVEDNEANQFIAEELLARTGITLTIAKHGHEAVAMVAAGDYDAVLMDLQLPEMNGLEATRIIRTNLAGRSLPIIALTANATQCDLEACHDAGMDDYVAKPIDPKLFFRVLRKWLLPNRASAAPVAEIAIAEVAFATAETSHAVAMSVSDVAASEVSPESSAEPVEPPPAGNADRAIDNSVEPPPAIAGSETGARADVAGAKPERKKRIRKLREAAEVATAIAPVSDIVSTGKTPAPVATPTVTEISPNTSASQLWEGAGDELEPAAPVRGAVVPVDEAVEPPPPLASSSHLAEGPPWEVTDPIKPAVLDVSVVEPATTSPAEAKPEKQKRPRKKKVSDGTQPDLFGDYDTTKDAAGPVEVTVEADGVPLVPGLDLREAMSRLALPLEAIREKADRFGGGLGQICRDLRAALAAQDNASARRHAHSLAGAAGSLSADTLRRLAKTLELALKFEQGDTQAMVAELEHEAARVAEGIRQLTALPEASSPTATEPAETGEPLDPARPTASRQIQAALEELAVALEGGDFDAISQRAEKLRASALPMSLAADYECLTEMVDNFDYAEAAALVRSMQERIV